MLCSTFIRIVAPVSVPRPGSGKVWASAFDIRMSA